MGKVKGQSPIGRAKTKDQEAEPLGRSEGQNQRAVLLGSASGQSQQAGPISRADGQRQGDLCLGVCMSRTKQGLLAAAAALPKDLKASFTTLVICNRAVPLYHSMSQMSTLHKTAYFEPSIVAVQKPIDSKR